MILGPEGEMPSVYSKAMEPLFFHLNIPEGFHTVLSTAVRGSQLIRATSLGEGYVAWEKSTTENHGDKTLSSVR